MRCWEKLKNLVNIMEKRSTFYDRGMRHLADERKKRPDDYDMRVDGEPEGKRSKHKRKKVSDSHIGQDGTFFSNLQGFLSRGLPVAQNVCCNVVPCSNQQLYR